jgi:autotransporter-associated beta strand protein
VGRTIAIPSLAVTANFNGALTTTVAAGSTGLTKTGNGTLQFGNASVLNFGGAGLTIAGGVIKAGKANNIPADSLLTVNAGAGYDLMGLAQASNAIAGAGFITNSVNAPADLTLNITTATAFSGVLADNRAASPTSTSALNLVKLGTGELTLTGASTYVGTTTLSAGKILVGNGGSLGTGGVIVDGILEYARTDTYSLANSFTSSSGTGELNFTGIGGVAKLVGNSGTTSGLNVGLTAGTLQFGDNGTTGSLDGLASLTISTGATLKFDRTDTYNFSTGITSFALNAGTIVQAGTGTTTLLGTNTNFTGDVEITAGELEAAGTSSLEFARQIVIGSAGSFRVSDDNALGSTGPGPDVILNGGLMRFLGTGANASFGAVNDLTLNGGTISSGTLAAGSGNSLYVTGAVSVTNDTTISARDVGFVQGGSLANTGFATDITVDPGKTLTLSGTIADDFFSNASSFDKKGAGTMVLSGNNAGMFGQVTVTAGTLVANHANAFGDGTVNAVSSFTAAATINNGGRVTSNAAAFSVAAPIAANITVNSGGSLGVGSTIGNFAATSLTLKGGALVEFKIWDVTQGAGIGYDKLDLGAMDLTGATSANRIKIVLKSMDTATTFGSAVLNLPTAPANFGTFDFGTYDFANSTPVSGNISDLFTFDTSQFTYTGGTASDAGLWMINFNTANGAITLTAVPEPSTYGFGIGALALAAAAIRRRRQTKKA